MGNLLNYLLFSTLMVWLLTNILAAYSIYFINASTGLVQICFQGSLLVCFSLWYFRWSKIIAVKQNVSSCIQFHRLTTDEYAVFSYVIPLFLSAIVQYTYTLLSGEGSWLSRSQTGLIFHMAIIYIVCMTLIRKCH